MDHNAGMAAPSTTTQGELCEERAFQRGVAAFDAVLETFGMWPPEPEFESWPACWLPYQHLCDTMPRMLKELGDPATFRTWMKQELLDKVDLLEVMEAINAHASQQEMRLLGFLGSLTYLNNAYRWGVLPAVKQERERTQLDFPKQLTAPLQKVASIYGTVPWGNHFNLITASNIVHPDVESPFACMRFHFNIDDHLQDMEDQFFSLFCESEIVTVPAVGAMRDFLELSGRASRSIEDAKVVFADRLAKLKLVRDTVRNLTRLLMERSKLMTFEAVTWAQYVQTPSTWDLEGNGGPSGSESLTIHFIDQFLSVPGDGAIYHSIEQKRQHMPTVLRNLSQVLEIDIPSKRFSCGFLLSDGEPDAILEERNAILRSMHMWRLGHARVVGRFTPGSLGLASRLDKEMKGTSVADKTDRELRYRAQETLAQITK